MIALLQKVYDRREVVQAACRIAEADVVYERAGEVVVERIGLPCADLRPQHGGLKSSRVPEIDAR